MRSANLSTAYAPLLELQARMRGDLEFKRLCVAAGLPWDPERGREPRGYNGPPPETVRLLFVMAEPGDITPTEAKSLRPPIDREPWIVGRDLFLQENYWIANLREVCREIWPDDTDRNMDRYVGGTSSFWMSLPSGSQTSSIPSTPLRYFLARYLPKILESFPNAVVLAAGAKARDRLRQIGRDFEVCSAFTKPESNKPRARQSWHDAGKAVASRLEGN